MHWRQPVFSKSLHACVDMDRHVFVIAPSAPPPPPPGVSAQARVALCREGTVFLCEPKRVASLLMAARDVGGGTSSARRRRERRQRSWWRHEQLSVAAALASARHHSAGLGVVSWREEQQEEVEQDAYDGPRALNTPPRATRPGVLQDPGPPWVEALTVGYVAAGAPSLVVAPVAAHDELDTASVQYLL